MKTSPIGIIITILMSCLLCSCIQTVPKQTAPSINLSAESINLQPKPQGRDFGIDVEVNESDSLENLARLPGVRISRVRKGSIGSQAGLRAGDVILSVNDRATNLPDEFLFSTSENSSAFALTVRRDTTVFSTTIPNSDSIAIKIIELYRADPSKTRAGYQLNEQGRVEIIAIADQSPLVTADLNIGDEILAINGEQITSAQALVTKLQTEFDFGERLILQTSKGERALQLWQPALELRKLAFLPLFQFQQKPRDQFSRISFFDFGIFSLLSYENNAGERILSLFGLIKIETGVGELDSF